MNKAIIALALFVPTLAIAAEAGKPSKAAACANYTIATTRDGATIGICGASKPGGKVTYLRTFQEISVIDPATDKPAKLLAGFE